MNFYFCYYYYYLRFALFFVHKKLIQPDYILWRHLGWTGGFVNTSLPMAGTSASPCRPALTVLCHHFAVPSSLLRHLGTGSGMEPCTAPSSDRAINAEHINQLSRFHAQSFKFLNFVRFD